MKIIVTGASTYGVDNMGDDAMLAGLIEGLNQNYDNPQIIFLTRHVNKTYDKIFGFSSVKNIDHDSKAESEGRFFFRYEQR